MPSWRDYVQDLPKLRRPLRVVLPCVGIDGCTHALQEMGIDVEATNVYDLIDGYDELLRHHYEACSKVVPQLHLGPELGDITKVALTDLIVPADGICAGPPCPPWAGNGLRGSDEDPRARVFETVLTWTAQLIKSGGLLFAVLENVVGCNQKIKGCPSFMRQVQDVLTQECGEFTWKIVTLSAADYMLAQTRVRVFLVGFRHRLGALPGPMEPFGPLPLREFLQGDLPNIARKTMTQCMQENLKNMEKTLAQDLKAGKLAADDVVCFAADRAQGKVFKQRYSVNIVPTLTTHNRYLFVLTLDFKKSDSKRGFFRWLHNRERMKLQGFVEDYADKLDSLALTASGNAYPVPLLCAVLYPIVQVLSQWTTFEQWPNPADIKQEVHPVAATIVHKLACAIKRSSAATAKQTKAKAKAKARKSKAQANATPKKQGKTTKGAKSQKASGKNRKKQKGAKVSEALWKRPPSKRSCAFIWSDSEEV